MSYCTKRVISYSIRRINNKQTIKQKVLSGTELMPYELEIQYKRQIPLHSNGLNFGFSMNLGFCSFIYLWIDEPKYNYFQTKLFKTKETAEEFGQTLRKGECQWCGETTK